MIKKIPITHLKPGMRVIDPGLVPLENPGLFSADMNIEVPDQISEIQAQGFAEVFIDTDQGTYFAENPEARESVNNYYSKALVGKGPETSRSRHIADMAGYVEQAEQFYVNTLDQVKEILESIEKKRNVPMTEANTVINNIIENVRENLDALVSVTKLKQFDDYTFTHSLNVTVYSIAFGMYLGLGDENIRMLAYSGLFHDAGKVCVPLEILNKPGKLTVSEFEVIKKHPTDSHRIVLDCAGLPPEVERCCLEHHERYAGDGYPDNKSYAQISRASSLISIVDMFDALTSNRCYKTAIHGHKALSIIFNLKNSAFLPMLVDKFVRFMGIYPIGSIVALSGGDKAVVIEQNAQNLLRPKVRIVLDKHNRHCPIRNVDLASEEYSKVPGYEITDCLGLNACRINVKAYLAR